MIRNSYAPPNAPARKEPLPRGFWARAILIVVLAAIVLPIVAFVARQVWRDRQLLAFCEAAKPGITFAELLALERQYSIDDSYSVEALFHGRRDQASSPLLEFRSQMYDPEFACAIAHDGQRVKSVQLLTLEGYDK